MMWVRFPNGQCIQYNRAGYVVRNTEYSDVYVKRGADSKGEGWIAQVPNSCIIELELACRVSNPLTEPKEDVTKELKSLRRLVNKALKK